MSNESLINARREIELDKMRKALYRLIYEKAHEGETGLIRKCPLLPDEVIKRELRAILGVKTLKDRLQGW